MKTYFAFRHSTAIWAYHFLPRILLWCISAAALLWSVADMVFFSGNGRYGVMQHPNIWTGFLLWCGIGAALGGIVYYCTKMICAQYLLRVFKEEYGDDIDLDC